MLSACRYGQQHTITVGSISDTHPNDYTPVAALKPTPFQFAALRQFLTLVRPEFDHCQIFYDLEEAKCWILSQVLLDSGTSASNNVTKKAAPKMGTAFYDSLKFSR
jgi:hypothetical protein